MLFYAINISYHEYIHKKRIDQKISRVRSLGSEEKLEEIVGLLGWLKKSL